MSFIPLQHKAAGHEGPMQSIDNSMFSKPSNQQEIDFYNATLAKKMKTDTDKHLGSLFSDWIPEFFGTLHPGVVDNVKNKNLEEIDHGIYEKSNFTLETEGREKKYILLENVLYGFKKPSIMDIKLGSILHDEFASDEKAERMKKVSKDTTSGSLKFRICGMKISDDFNKKLPKDIPGISMRDVCNVSEEEDYLSFNKFFGRQLTKDTMEEGLRIFFRYNGLPSTIQDIIIKNFCLRLQMIYNCLLEEELRIVSGSLFFVYENDIERWEKFNYEDPLIKERFIDESDNEDNEDEDQQMTEAPLSCLKFIDFAHAKYTPREGHDEELVAGIENLFMILENI